MPLRLHLPASSAPITRRARRLLPLTLLLVVAGQACAQGEAKADGGADERAADPIAHVPWAPMGAHQVGDRVRYRGAGTLWYDGVIREVGPTPSMPDITREQYLIDGQGWYDHMYVSGTERQPFWTGFFVGDWQVSVPMAMNTRVIGDDLYRVVSGGMPLPPLRVYPDGRYAWRVTDGAGTERVIEGRWEPRADAPGIILRRADQGADWELYHNTDASSRRTFATAQIYLSSDCCTALTASRIPTAAPGPLAVGDRVFHRRENGTARLGTVAAVEGDRVQLTFQYLDPAWVPVEELRAVEFP